MRIILFALCVLSFGCQMATPDAGHEAVLVAKPWVFGHGGVFDDPVTTGSSFVAMTTNVIYVSLLPQQFEEHFDDLMSSDGVPLDFDAVIRLQVTDSVGIIKNFGPDWYGVNVKSEFRNRVRQAVRVHGMNETAISTTAIDEIDSQVSEAMELYILESALPLKLIQVTVGKANPPDSIETQRIETATQQQRQLTEEQRKLAEDSRLQAEQSRAAADNAYRNEMNLSPAQFLQLENIKMLRDVCGRTPCTFLIGGDGVSPVYNVR